MDELSFPFKFHQHLYYKLTVYTVRLKYLTIRWVQSGELLNNMKFYQNKMRF